MPSVDVVSKLNIQEIDNAIHSVQKELSQRYDFRNSKSKVELNKNEKILTILADDEMKYKAMQEIILQRLAGRKVSPKIVDFGKEEKAAGSMIRVIAKLKDGVDGDTARKIVKMVKETKLKVQGAIQGEQVRLSGNKIDDLQTIIHLLLKDESIPVPLQFVNMKR